MNRPVLLLLCTFLGAVSGTQAALEFESKRSTYQAKPSDTTFESTFQFKNTGDHPIVIHEVDTNCGCILAETDQNRYEKGASGTVTAVFKIGSAEGVQTKQVTVTYYEDKPGAKKTPAKTTVKAPAATSSQALDPKNLKVPSTLKAPAVPRSQMTTERLTVELNVPAVIEIEPKIAKWPVGTEPVTKKVTVTMKHDDPIAIREVVSSRESVEVEVKEIEAGRHYELHLTPKTTESVQLGMLTIHTDCRIAKHQKKLAFFSIHRPTPTPRKIPQSN